MLTSHELLFALIRATLCTSVAISLAWLLNASLRAASPRFQRAAWTLAIAQSWLLFPWTLEIETPSVPRPFESSVWIATSNAELSPNAKATADDFGGGTSLRHDSIFAALCPWIVGIWIAGASVLILSRAVRYLRFVRQLPKRNAGLALSEEWQQEWLAQLNQLSPGRIRRRIDLRVTGDLGPLVCFVPFHYLVLTPLRLWQSLARPEREAILQHEMAHVTRGDIWKSLAIRLLALPQWFNPLVWRAIRNFDEAAEWACDDRVARAGQDNLLDLAKSLVRAAEFATAGVPGTASVQGGVLSRRIRRLVTPQTKEGSKMKKFMLLTLLVSLAAVESVRIERVAAAPQDATTKSSAALPVPPPEITGPIENLPGSHQAWTGKEPYVIEPPDILQLSIVKLTPTPSYAISHEDTLVIGGIKTTADEKPVWKSYAIDANGDVSLGADLAPVHVLGRTQAEVEAAITEVMRTNHRTVTVKLICEKANGILSDKVLVNSNGRIDLHQFGTVKVTGKTIGDARAAIQELLSKYFDDPQINVEVYRYNSKKVYIVERDDSGQENVKSVPFTGSEKVLDVIAMIGGVPDSSSKVISIVRPAPNGVEHERPVNWADISTGKSMESNYPLQGGDRLFISTNAVPNREPIKAAPPSPHQLSPTAFDKEAVSAAGKFEVPVVYTSGSGKTFPVVKAVCDENTTAGSAIAQVKAWPNPVNLTRTAIDIRRETDGHKKIFPVAWNPATRQPTEETNHALRPGDEIVIREQSAPLLAQAQRPPGTSPNAPIATKVLLPDAYEGKTLIRYKILIFKLSSGSVEALKPMIVDTSAVAPIMQILQDTKMLEMMSRPQMISAAGETAWLQVGQQRPLPSGELVTNGIEFEVVGSETDKGILLATKCRTIDDGKPYEVESTLVVADGKSAILKFKTAPTPPSADGGANTKAESKPIYIVLTPEIVRKADARGPLK